MSSCEKCWEDAQRIAGQYGDVTAVYHRLLKESPCSPEQQAGTAAGVCPQCGRKTLHQWTGQCMAGCTT